MNVEIARACIDILTIFVLPIHEHGMISVLYVFLNFFPECPVVFRVQILVSLGGFIRRYLMVFSAMVNGIDSSVSLSSISLLVYRNATDFCAWISYPAALLNSGKGPSNVGVASFGFST